VPVECAFLLLITGLILCSFFSCGPGSAGGHKSAAIAKRPDAAVGACQGEDHREHYSAMFAVGCCGARVPRTGNGQVGSVAEIWNWGDREAAPSRGNTTYQVVRTAEVLDASLPVPLLSQQFIDFVVEVPNLEFSEARVLNLTNLQVKVKRIPRLQTLMSSKHMQSVMGIV
jgi:hypothetical protein